MQSRFQRVKIVTGLEMVSERQRRPTTNDLDLEVPIAAFVVSFDRRDLDAQKPSLSGLGIQEAHGIGG